ncbi:protein LNK2-like [Aristolochia californica]|uniref:protein LNK2-like n=1 Tax=Aristolochia californica TaxID=171875 RepID=UPI0035DECD22
MFEWTDEEIADIIWGEPGESDDHIVPYPKDHNENTSFSFGEIGKEQCIQDTNVISKSVEEKTLGVKNDLPDIKVETSPISASEVLSASGLGLGSLTDLPASSVDNNGGSKGTELSNFTDVTNFNLVKGEPELFGNEHEDKESDGFLDYNWANIGNFDDLDRIFRNDDTILGREMIGSADELWSSSAAADMIDNSPTQSFSVAASSLSSEFQAIRNTTERYKGEIEFVPYKNQSPSSDTAKRNNLNSFGPQNVLQNKVETTKFFNLVTGGKSSLEEKANRQRKFLKTQKNPEETNEPKFKQSLTGASSTPVNQLQQYANARVPVSALQSFPTSVLGGPESLRYLHGSNPYMHTGYGYPVHQFPVISKLPLMHSDRDKHQILLENYCKLSPDSLKKGRLQKRLADVHTGPPIMTPQEKIEKLRRRQQVQAMLAIQRHQQKLGNQISGADQKTLNESQGQDFVANSIGVEENTISIQPPFEMSLPLEQDESSKTSMSIDIFSLAESIFDQLQDAIGKLDKKTRLCIRDSLFRLARSVMLRHSVSDTSSTNKNSRDEQEVVANEEIDSNGRSTRVPDAETDTNPIDRSMAHLLFHRPTEPSVGSCIKEGAPGSPVSTNPEKLALKPKLENVGPGTECISDSKTGNQFLTPSEIERPPPPEDLQQGNIHKASP